MTVDDSKKTLRCPIDIDEAEALIEYASRKGIHKDDIPAKLNSAIEAFNLEPEVEHEANIITLYAKLCELTGKVSGKMCIDGREFHRTTFNLKACTIAFTVVALFLAGLDSLVLDIDPPDPMNFMSLWAIHTYFLNIVEPFVWGGLGACVYLIKLVSDLKSAHIFDKDQYPGWQSRILLGAVLGGGFAYLFDPTQLVDGDFAPNAIAFVAGMMIKVIYGALEKFADSIAEKFDIGNIRSGSRRSDAINDFLARALSDINQEDDKAMYDAIVELLKRRGKSNG